MKIIKTVVLFLVGFCVYITLEVLFRGYSYAIMGICSGLAILIIDQINNKISWDLDLFLQGIIGSAIITGMELLIGEYMQFIGSTPMWDYSDMLLNFDGIICLPFSILWMFLSWVAIFIADAINYYVFEETPIPYYKMFGKQIIKFKTKHS